MTNIGTRAPGIDLGPVTREMAKAARGLALLTKRQYDGMAWNDTVLLSWETRAALQLIGHGAELLRDRPLDDVSEVVFAVLAPGVERLIKVSQGFAHLSRREGWPQNLPRTHSVMRLHADLMTMVTSAAAGTEHEATVAREQLALDEDKVLQALLSALDDYGARGRYQYLDELARDPKARPGALGGWLSIFTSVDGVRWDESEMTGDQALAAAARMVDEALRRWLAALSRFAEMGVLGRRGRQLERSIKECFPTLGTDNEAELSAAQS